MSEFVFTSGEPSLWSNTKDYGVKKCPTNFPIEWGKSLNEFCCQHIHILSNLGPSQSQAIIGVNDEGIFIISWGNAQKGMAGDRENFILQGNFAQTPKALSPEKIPQWKLANEFLPKPCGIKKTAAILFACLPFVFAIGYWVGAIQCFQNHTVEKQQSTVSTNKKDQAQKKIQEIVQNLSVWPRMFYNASDLDESIQSEFQKSVQSISLILQGDPQWEHACQQLLSIDKKHLTNQKKPEVSNNHAYVFFQEIHRILPELEKQWKEYKQP